jgi:maltose O-acetyltransferase
MKKITKYICWIFYHYFAQYLPSNSQPFGRISKKIRYLLSKRLFKFCGENVNIERKAYFENGFEIEIGNNSGIGINANISNNTKIGKNVLMGPDVIILSGSHRYESKNMLIKDQGYEKHIPVIIEDDVWIGSRVIILKGVTIHKGAVIGAGSIVTKSVEEYSVVAGNPAKKIKTRI